MELQKTLERLRSSVDEVVTKLGFHSEGSDTVLDGRRFHTWTRDAGWKLDHIIFVNRIGSPQELIVNFEVRLPLLDGRKILLDGQGLNWLAGNKSPTYNLMDGLLRRTGSEKSMPRVLSDLKEQLAWFDQYGTPQDCIGRLQVQGERNGCRAAFPPALEHLQLAAARS